MKNQREIKKKDPEFYRKLLALLIPMVVQNLMNALVSASEIGRASCRERV